MADVAGSSNEWTGPQPTVDEALEFADLGLPAYMHSASYGRALRVLAAEVRRIRPSHEPRTLPEADLARVIAVGEVIDECIRWHEGDKWRESTVPEHRAVWEKHQARLNEAHDHLISVGSAQQPADDDALEALQQVLLYADFNSEESHADFVAAVNEARNVVQRISNRTITASPQPPGVRPEFRRYDSDRGRVCGFRENPHGDFASWHDVQRWLDSAGYSGATKRSDAVLCEDCPPVGSPTDKTRCAECPRRQS